MNPDLQKYLDGFMAQHPDASRDDVRGVSAAWLQAHEAATSSDTPPPDDPSTDVSFRNIGRSLVQGGTYGMADKFGLVDQAKQRAFAAKHPWINGAAELVGGAVAPIAAVAAAPEIFAGAAGAAALGAGAGLLNGVGQGYDESTTDRLKHGLFGAGVGGTVGELGYGLSKPVAGAAGAVASRFNPARNVGQAGKDLITPDLGGATDHLTTDVAGHMKNVNDIIQLHNLGAAPGSSIATATVPPSGPSANPRFQAMLGDMDGNPNAAARSENNLLAQNKVLDATAKIVGKKMDAFTGDVPDSPALQNALDKARVVLKGRTPEVAPASQTVPLQDLRAALRTVRAVARPIAAQGADANGTTAFDVGTARHALEDVIYTHEPALQPLDAHYGVLKGEQRRVEDLLPTVEAARSGGASAEASGGSGGAMPPHSISGVVLKALASALKNKSGGADAVADIVMRPGGPEMVKMLLSKAPGTTLPKITKSMRAGLFTALPPALRSGMFSQDSTP